METEGGAAAPIEGRGAQAPPARGVWLVALALVAVGALVVAPALASRERAQTPSRAGWVSVDPGALAGRALAPYRSAPPSASAGGELDLARDAEALERQLMEDPAAQMRLFERFWPWIIDTPGFRDLGAFARAQQELFVEAGRYARFVEVLEEMHAYGSLVGAVGEAVGGPVGEALRAREGRLGEVVPLLIWGRHELGLDSSAWALAREAVHQAPEEAEVVFLYGLLLGQREGAATGERLHTLRNLFARVIALEPSFSMFGLTARDLRQQLAMLDEAIRGQGAAAPPPLIEAARAGVHGRVARARQHALTYRMNAPGFAAGWALGERAGQALSAAAPEQGPPAPDVREQQGPSVPPAPDVREQQGPSVPPAPEQGPGAPEEGAPAPPAP